MTFLSTQISGQSNELVESNATLQKLSSEFTFTEGPAVDANGNVFFTDQPNNQILKWSANGGISVYMKDAGRSNGMFFDADGNLITCADENNEIWKISPQKAIDVLVKDFHGKRFNGPNDLWIDSKGGIYFTDPYYKREYRGKDEKEMESENVYYLSADQKLRMVADGFQRPNGIIGSADGTQLYVSDIGAGKTYVFTIEEDASLSEKSLFVEKGSDGMTLDELGNVYLTGNGVMIFDKSGNEIYHIDTGEKWTANVCFGGPEMRTLFITAMKSVYTLEMNVSGIR